MNKKLTILIVDDEKDIRFLFEQHFKEEIKSEQINFYYALSAEEALKTLQTIEKTQIVLILSDINMPGMSGIELLKQIKLAYPQMTVFMITAYGDSKNCQLAWEHGAAEILNKPLNFSYLKNLIIEFRRLYKIKGMGSDHD